MVPWRRLARGSAQQGRPVQIDGRERRRGLAPGSAGFQRGGKEAMARRKGSELQESWRCELARIIDARDVRDPRDKGLGTHTSGHQLAALARLHLASRFRLEVKWHVASNPPAERSQISVQPRDVLVLLLFWSRWYQDGRLLRQVEQCRDLCMHMCHLPWSYCRAEQQTSGFQIAAEFLCTRGGCDNPNGWPSTATPLPVLCALACVSSPGQPRGADEVDVGRRSQ